MTLPQYKIVVTDFDGTPHTITDNVETLEVTTELSNSSDTFSFTIANMNDVYSYIEKGCTIVLEIGMGTTQEKLSGYITEVTKTLDSTGIMPTISVSGEDLTIVMNNLYFSGKFYDIEVSALIHAIMSSVDYTTGKTYYELTGVFASSALLDATPYTIEEVTYNWKSLASIVNDLADAVGYVWLVHPVFSWRLLRFFDAAGDDICATIVDSDLEGPPTITDISEIVNRVVVVGGYEQVLDKEGNSQTTTSRVTNIAAKNQSFVPTEDYLSSVLVYTELVTDSESDLTISIQNDSAAAPDGTNLSNGQINIKLDSIVDGGYTELRFRNPVTLTPGTTYWIVLMGTTADGVDVGEDGSAVPVLDYKTRCPSRVAIMANDLVSQDKYGMYMAVFRDSNLEDAQFAENKANSMLMPEPKKAVSLTLRDDEIEAGNVVQLTLSTVGVAIAKQMKVVSSTMTIGENFIYNDLELEELQ